MLVEIPFHGDNLIAVEKNGNNYVSIRRVCNAIGIDYSSQLAKLRKDPNANVVRLTTLDEAGRNINMSVVDWEYVPIWLSGIHVNFVLPEVRPKLVKYQKEVKEVLAAHFLGNRKQTAIVQVAKQQIELFDEESDADLVVLAKLYKARKDILAVQRAQEAQWKAIKATELVALEADQTAQEAIVVAHIADVKADAAHKAITNASGWFSAMAFSKLLNLDVPLPKLSALGRKATALCDSKGIAVQKVEDPRFGTVGTYPKNVLNELLTEFVARSSTPQATRQPLA